MKKKKNSKAIVLLIIAVAGIWGTIGWKVITGVGNDGPSFLVQKPLVAENKSVDTLQIVLSYSNPFSRKKVVNKVKAKSKKKQKKRKKQKKVIIWPSIDYQGKIVTSKTNKNMAVLNINGKHNTVAEGEKWEEVLVIKCMSDSVKLKFNGEYKTIMK